MLWDHYFEINESKLTKVNLTEDNINRCKMFDWLAYLALIKHTFKDLNLDKVKEYDAKIYK